MHTVAPPRARRSPDGSRRRRGRARRVAVAGATGYTGQELLRLLSRHPAVALTRGDVVGADRRVARRLPALTRLWNGIDHAARRPRRWRATPTSCSSRCPMRRPPSSRRRSSTPACASSICPAPSGCATPTLRARWYPETHRLPDGRRLRPDRARARRRSRARSWSPIPGCYPTAALLALAPLVDAGLLVPGADIIVDAKSGVSGAGKTPSERTHFSEVHGSLSAYGVFGHRHGAEIEQGLGRDGHLHAAPGAARPRHSRDDLRARRAGHDRRGARRRATSRPTPARPFVRLVGSALPEIKHVAHTNFCDIGWRVDAVGPRRFWCRSSTTC